MATSRQNRNPAVASLFPAVALTPLTGGTGVAARAVATFCPVEDHEGQPGWVQGGFIATVLDYVAACAASHSFGEQVVTGQLTVRYRKPVLLSGGPYPVVAEVEKASSRMATVRVTISTSGKVGLAEGVGLFVVAPEAASFLT